MSGEHPARRAWRAVERVHAVVYFAPAVGEALAGVGVPGFWRGYFAARAAPLGPVPAEVVTAAFFGFHPAMVARAVPDVWSRCAPEAIVEARRAGAAAALVALAGATVDAAEVERAAGEAGALVAGLDVAGRPLAAANRAVPLIGDGWARLWQACTTLREHRGDGHGAALTTAGLTGAQAHVLQVATAPVPRTVLQDNRGWSDGDWAGASAALAERGWLDAAGRATAAGRAAKDGVEVATDRAAATPWAGNGGAALLRVCDAVGQAVDHAGVVPYPNPMGLPAPTLGATCRSS